MKETIIGFVIGMFCVSLLVNYVENEGGVEL